MSLNTSETTNPCFECGQCCQHFRVSFYHGEIEGNGAGIVPGDLTTKLTDHLACMKGTEKGSAPCIALKHTKEEGWRCSIYEQRPSPCREFNVFNEDGTMNKDCQKLRMKIGLFDWVISLKLGGPFHAPKSSLLYIYFLAKALRWFFLIWGGQLCEFL